MKKEQKANSEESSAIIFKVFLGGLSTQPKIERLANTAWSLSTAAIWNTSKFSEREVSKSKEIIATFISAFRKPESGYKVFCQRMLLAREYIINRPGRFIPLPSTWLDKENVTGFRGTKDWYQKIVDVRSSLPEYRAELKALAEAVLEMSEEPTAGNYSFWRDYFIDRNHAALLGLFQSAVANQQFRS